MIDRYTSVARDVIAASQGVPARELRGMLAEVHHWRDQTGHATPLIAALSDAFEAALDSRVQVAGP